MGWLGKRRRKKREEEEEVVEEALASKPTGPELLVLVPEVAGAPTFHVNRFQSADDALNFIKSSLTPDALAAAHIFWAMHDCPPPDISMESGGEALVLIRGGHSVDAVHVVSFVDLDSAESFARFEVKRGLDLGFVLIYWAAFATVIETPFGMRLDPPSPPDPRQWRAAALNAAATRTLPTATAARQPGFQGTSDHGPDQRSMPHPASQQTAAQYESPAAAPIPEQIAKEAPPVQPPEPFVAAEPASQPEPYPVAAEGPPSDLRPVPLTADQRAAEVLPEPPAVEEPAAQQMPEAAVAEEQIRQTVPEPVVAEEPSPQPEPEPLNTEESLLQPEIETVAAEDQAAERENQPIARDETFAHEPAEPAAIVDAEPETAAVEEPAAEPEPEPAIAEEPATRFAVHLDRQEDVPQQQPEEAPDQAPDEPDEEPVIVPPEFSAEPATAPTNGHHADEDVGTLPEHLHLEGESTSTPGDEEIVERWIAEALERAEEQAAAHLEEVVEPAAPERIDATQEAELVAEPQIEEEPARGKRQKARAAASTRGDKARDDDDEAETISIDVNEVVAKTLRVKRWKKQEEPFKGFDSPPGRF